MVDDVHLGGRPRPAAPHASSYELYCNGNKTDRACNCVRFTLTPVFGGANTGTVQIFTMAADGTGSGTAGHHPRARSGSAPTAQFAGDRPCSPGRRPERCRAASSTIDDGRLCGLGTPATGDRIGFAVHYVEGRHPGRRHRLAPRM